MQVPLLWAGQRHPVDSSTAPQLLATAIHHIQKRRPMPETYREADSEDVPLVCYAFYRKQTEGLLKRYLYASMQVGRSPNLIGESVGRGWVSSRRVRTFEDALIFVLDMERCLNKLTRSDLQIVTRVSLQDYTHAETAVLMGMSTRSIGNKLSLALDRLTESLVEAHLLELPD